MRSFRYLSLVSTIWISSLHAILPNLETVQTQTAVTLPSRHYHLDFRMYENGGIYSRVAIGLLENFTIGLSSDIENALGQKNPRMNVPGIIAKLKFTNGFGRFPILISAGYDSFYIGALGKITDANSSSRMIYGPYFAITKPLFLSLGEPNLHWGIRYPIQPIEKSEDISTYIAFDFPLGQLVPMIEIDRIYFNSTRLDEVLFGAAARYSVTPNFALEFKVVSGPKTAANRILGLQFMDTF
jgi:hypothetical protein